jgi:limonene-1,2-epoxide hydrolase
MAVNCEKVVGDLFAAWTRLNLDEVMSHFAEDAVWDNVPMSPAKGKQAIREMTHGFMKDTSAFSVNILKSLHEGNVVFNSRVDTITMKNGKKAEIPVAGMFELDDGGKIRVWRDYFDLATFTKQIS